MQPNPAMSVYAILHQYHASATFTVGLRKTLILAAGIFLALCLDTGYTCGV